MKNIRKYILAVVTVLLALPMAQAQKPYTGEESQYIIFGKDSLCMLMPDVKGYGVFTGESLKKKKREILGFEVEELSQLNITMAGYAIEYLEYAKKNLRIFHGEVVIRWKITTNI